jgi:hypothetical protein
MHPAKRSLGGYHEVRQVRSVRCRCHRSNGRLDSRITLASECAAERYTHGPQTRKVPEALRMSATASIVAAIVRIIGGMVITDPITDLTMAIS